VSYNRDDTENLRNLADVVANRLHEESIGAVADESAGVPDPRV
jgi:uncharacterized protein YprB with RNaseH-like and TPR domain